MPFSSCLAEIEQIVDRDAKRVRKLQECAHGRITRAALQIGNIAALYRSPLRKFLL